MSEPIDEVPLSRSSWVESKGKRPGERVFTSNTVHPEAGEANMTKVRISTKDISGAGGTRLREIIKRGNEVRYGHVIFAERFGEKDGAVKII